MKQCPNGHEVSDNVKFCPECGAEIIDNDAKFCAKCRNERKGTEKFCPKCGTPYVQSSTSNVSDTKVGQGKSSKKGFLIAFVVAVIALIGGAAWYFLRNQQDKYSLEGLAKAVVNYDMVSDFHEGLAIVSKGDKYGFIDRMGNEVIPCIYEFMEEVDLNFHDGLAFVRQGEKYFFINKEGKEAFPYNYDAGLNFSEGLALVWKERKCGYIDTNGKEVIPLTDKYYGSSFSDGLATVRNDEGKYGFIDKEGKVVIPMVFDVFGYGETSDFHEGLAPICKNEKYGYIDKSGKEVIPCKYDEANDFNDGMALVAVKDKDNGYLFGYIDTEGKEIIPCRYCPAGDFCDGIAIVAKDMKFTIIDKKGNEVAALSQQYENATFSFSEGMARVSRFVDSERKSGYIDVHGKEIIPCIYSSFSNFSEGLALVEKDGIYGFVDKKGNSTFDIQDEAVKSVVQAKIQEREEARKEEERRAEEERKRIEEENKPQNKFTRIAQNGNVAWVIRRTGQMAFFYPIDNTYGKVDFLNMNGNDVLMSSGSTTYTLSNNHISFNYKADVWGQLFYMSFTGTIEHDGDKVKLVGQYSGSTVNGTKEVTLDQVRPLIKDPFKD